MVCFYDSTTLVRVFFAHTHTHTLVSACCLVAHWCGQEVWGCAGLSQVQWRLPQPQHGSEAPGTGSAGLQAAAIQSGEVWGEGEDRARDGQTASGEARSTPLSTCRGARLPCSYMHCKQDTISGERHKCWLDMNTNSRAHAYCTCALLHPRKLAGSQVVLFQKGTAAHLQARNWES